MVEYSFSRDSRDWFSHHRHRAAEMVAFAEAEALKAAPVAPVKKLYSSENATHPPVHVALIYHLLPVVHFQAVVLQYRGFMSEPSTAVLR